MIPRTLIRKFPRPHQRQTQVRHHAPISSQAPTHHDLPSFLGYASTTGLSPKSTLYVGTHYEYLCAATLIRLSFSLTRIGGPSDAGIDLFGTWKLPTIPYPLRVLVQCKALTAKVSPKAVRELEGVAAGAPEGWRGSGTIGVLCAKRPATRGVRKAVRRSGMPVVWIMIEDVGHRGGRVRQLLWNQRVSELGTQGMAVGLEHMAGEKAGMESEAVLLWKGKPWKSDGDRRVPTILNNYDQGTVLTTISKDEHCVNTPQVTNWSFEQAANQSHSQQSLKGTPGNSGSMTASDQISIDSVRNVK